MKLHYLYDFYEPLTSCFFCLLFFYSVFISKTILACCDKEQTLSLTYSHPVIRLMNVFLCANVTKMLGVS